MFCVSPYNTNTGNVALHSKRHNYLEKPLKYVIGNYSICCVY